MSHIVAIDFQCKSLDAVRATCDRLGFTFCEGQTSYKWWGRWEGDSPLLARIRLEDLGKCDHAIRVPGSRYEVGIVKMEDGSYDLRWDYIHGPLCNAMGGPSADKFRQAYQIEVARIEARRKGARFQEFRLPDGTVKLRITPR